jgi:hypothetical protein
MGVTAIEPVSASAPDRDVEIEQAAAPADISDAPAMASEMPTTVNTPAGRIPSQLGDQPVVESEMRADRKIDPATPASTSIDLAPLTASMPDLPEAMIEPPVSVGSFEQSVPAIRQESFRPDPRDVTMPAMDVPAAVSQYGGEPDMEAIRAGGNRMMARRTDLTHEQKMEFAAKSGKRTRVKKDTVRPVATPLPASQQSNDRDGDRQPSDQGDEPLFGPSSVPLSQQEADPTPTVANIAEDARPTTVEADSRQPSQDPPAQPSIPAPAWDALNDLPQTPASRSSLPQFDPLPSSPSQSPYAPSGFEADSPLMQAAEYVADEASSTIAQLGDLLSRFAFEISALKQQIATITDRLDHGDSNEFR